MMVGLFVVRIKKWLKKHCKLTLVSKSIILYIYVQSCAQKSIVLCFIHHRRGEWIPAEELDYINEQRTSHIFSSTHAGMKTRKPSYKFFVNKQRKTFYFRVLNIRNTYIRLVKLGTCQLFAIRSTDRPHLVSKMKRMRSIVKLDSGLVIILLIADIIPIPTPSSSNKQSCIRSLILAIRRRKVGY